MNLFFDFAIPTRVARCQTKKEILKLIDTWNGLVNCYLSVNPYEVISIDEFNNEIRNTHVNKIFFDIDNNDSSSAKKMVDYLLKEDLKFEIFHSGGGYHIYVYCKENNCPDNMRIAQLSILHETKAIVDMHCTGDLQRVSRIPNTFNFKSNSYCVPIRVEDLGTEREKGITQRFEKIQYGTKLLNLSTYTEEKFEYIKPDVVTNMQINTNIILIPCIRNIVKKINPTQTERYTLVVYLSNAIRNGKDMRGFDRGTLTEEIMKFFKENCTHWMDWNPTKTVYQINNIVPKTNIICGCKFLKSKNVCIDCIPGGI